jgi:hypothetical protein
MTNILVDSRSIEVVKEEKFLSLTEEQWEILFKISWVVLGPLVLMWVLTN